MRIKSFIAATVQEALKSVKREMGDASIILETRNIEEGDIKSKAGQTLVEVIAAENNKIQREDQDSDQDEELKDGQDEQDGRSALDSESLDQDQSDTAVSDMQQSEQYSAAKEHENTPEDHMNNVAISDHLHSDRTFEPVDPTSKDRLDGLLDTAPSGKVRQVSNWIVESKPETSMSNVDHGITNNGYNSESITSSQNGSESSALSWFPSEKYSSVKKQTRLTGNQEGSVALSDHLPAEDLIEMAGFNANEMSTTLDYQQNCDSSSGWSETSKELFKHLRIQQVEEEHSILLINEAMSRLSNDEYDKKELNLQMLREGIIHKIKISDSSASAQKECKTMVFVGAAGTGKTTTILKLACGMKRESDKDILLISIRGHSAEKLKRTADRVGVTLRTVTTHRELKDIVDQNQSTSHIFIDTPGIGYLDDNGLSGLKGFLDEIPKKEIHLVVSATTRYADIINVVDKLTMFHLDRLHFTKVDETCLHGTLFSVAMETQIPLSCISDGQEVPEDLRPVTSEMVADMILEV